MTKALPSQIILTSQTEEPDDLPELDDFSATLPRFELTRHVSDIPPSGHKDRKEPTVRKKTTDSLLDLEVKAKHPLHVGDSESKTNVDLFY